MRILGINQSNFATAKAAKTQNQNRNIYSAANFKGMEDTVSFMGHNRIKAGLAALIATLGFLTGTASASAVNAAKNKADTPATANHSEYIPDMAAAPTGESAPLYGRIIPAANTNVPTQMPVLPDGPVCEYPTSVPVITEPTGAHDGAYGMLMEAWIETTQTKVDTLDKIISNSYDSKILNGYANEATYKDRAKFVTQREQIRDENIATKLSTMYYNSEALIDTLTSAIQAFNDKIAALDKAIENDENGFTGEGSFTWERDLLNERKQFYTDCLNSVLAGDKSALPKKAVFAGEGPGGVYIKTPEFAITGPVKKDEDGNIDPRSYDGHRLTNQIQSEIIEEKIKDINKEIDEINEDILSGNADEESYEERAELVEKRERLRDGNIGHKMEWTGSVLSSRETVEINILRAEYRALEGEINALNKAIENDENGFTGEGSFTWERDLLAEKQKACKERLAQIYADISSRPPIPTGPSYTFDLDSELNPVCEYPAAYPGEGQIPTPGN